MKRRHSLIHPHGAGTRRLRRLLLGAGVTTTVALFASCDLIVVLLAIAFIGPLYPGQPQPPAPAPICPITVPSGEAPLPPVPEDLEVSDVVIDCDLPERPALARLNRAELHRSIQALTGVDTDLVQTLPPDTTGAGLDVIAALHTVSPLLVERLEKTARDAVSAAMRLPGDEPLRTTIEAETAVGVFEEDNGFVTMRGGALSFPIRFSMPGTWAVRVRVAPQALDGEAPRLLLQLDGDDLLETSLAGPRNQATTLEVRTAVLAEGNAFQPVHRLNVVHLNHAEKDGRHRAILLDAIEVEGPFDPPTRGPLTEARAHLLPCAARGDAAAALTEDCARDALQTFAFRAWRGQVTRDDVDRLHALYQQERDAGDDIETSLTTAMSAVLLSPHFLFRLELDAVGLGEDEHRLLGDQELAARLAALFWSSTPDDRLLALAADGALRDERVLRAEAARLLQDPRSTAVVERFMGAWLGLEALDHARPDPDRFPTFDEDLRTSMRCEAELLIDDVFRGGGGLPELFLAQTGHLNHRLAAHYGLPPPARVEGGRSGYVDTNIAAIHRAGLLSTGAILTMTSQPTRTSPTRRGKWVLDRLMCTTPPPPPPGVEGLIEASADAGEQSVRALLEAHRESPECAACHDFIDPMGLALERFDGVGRRRSADGPFAIDDSAFWFGDENDVVRGHEDLARRLADDALVARCFAQRALSYGTGIVYSDDEGGTCAIDDVAARAAASGGSLQDVLTEVVLSPAFRARRRTDVANITLHRLEGQTP